MCRCLFREDFLMSGIDSNARLLARRKRLDDYPGEGTPPDNRACELLCEDHVGTYELPYSCHWSGGEWRNLATNEPVIGGVVAWRIKSGDGGRA
jgi:hypothetical protein